VFKVFRVHKVRPEHQDQPDEVWIGPSDPGATYEFWFDTDEPTVVTVAHGISHELGGTDQVRIGKLIRSGTLAQQPTGLTAADSGLLYQVLAPYNHTVRWSGTVWEFAPGDCGNGYLADRAFAPQEAGWQICDGSATDYLEGRSSIINCANYYSCNVRCLS
jgi:hypothetical protein